MARGDLLLTEQIGPASLRLGWWVFTSAQLCAPASLALLMTALF